jgi:hypothetical protein
MLGAHLDLAFSTLHQRLLLYWLQNIKVVSEVENFGKAFSASQTRAAAFQYVKRQSGSFLSQIQS